MPVGLTGFSWVAAGFRRPGSMPLTFRQRDSANPFNLRGLILDGIKKSLLPGVEVRLSFSGGGIYAKGGLI